MRHFVVQKRDWLICRHALPERVYQARVARGREPCSPILHAGRNFLATRGRRKERVQEPTVSYIEQPFSLAADTLQ